MGYEDYFLRIQDCKQFKDEKYSRQITPPAANKKDINLYKDCFSNHTEFASPHASELIYDSKSTSRYIQRDNLSSFFVNKIYVPPKIFEYNSRKVIPYNDFIKEFAESSFYVLHKNDGSYMLGSNRIRYIVGDVGQGKTAFMKRVYCDLSRHRSELDETYEVLSVYMDLEKIFNYSEIPISLKDKFESDLFNRIMECMAEAKRSSIVNNLLQINPHNDPRLSLKYLIYRAKEEQIRFLIYIDNLDFYHYFYARYCFFEEGNKQQSKSIMDNIKWLISSISDPEALGHLGLNIMIAVRSYVYDEIVASRHGIKTDTDSSMAICLERIPDNLVVSSRIDLFAKAVEIVQKEKPATDLNEILQKFKIKFTDSKIEKRNNINTPLKKIYCLGQHGYRSLVHFISSLNLTPSNIELFNRFFDRQVSSLYLLYFNNMYQRYTQEKNHFPNIFLIDCTVMDGRMLPEAHQPHMHTYWLKYFVLRYIYNHKDEGVKLSRILEIFRDIGEYDDHVVRHVVGSLCMANEFRCAETMLNQTTRPFYARKIYPTRRGKSLMKGRPGDDLCFNFMYLRTIMDDKWLSYPKKYFDELYDPDSDYSHLFDTGHNYVNISIKSVFNDAKRALLFLRILSATYTIEIQQNKPRLHKILNEEGLIPDIGKAQENVIKSARGLLRALVDRMVDKKIEQLRDMLKKINATKQYEEFFDDYYKDINAKVSP